MRLFAIEKIRVLKEVLLKQVMPTGTLIKRSKAIKIVLKGAECGLSRQIAFGFNVDVKSFPFRFEPVGWQPPYGSKFSCSNLEVDAEDCSFYTACPTFSFLDFNTYFWFIIYILTCNLPNEQKRYVIFYMV